MVESHAIPNELLRSSHRELSDGLYAANFQTPDAEVSGVLYKYGNHLSGGDGGIAFFGRMFGGASVTMHFEVHCHGDLSHPVFNGFESTTYELDGHLTTAGAQLRGVDDAGRELSLSLRLLR